MEDEVISFQLAKLAKKKNFPQKIFNTSWYNSFGDLDGRTDLNKDGKTYHEAYDSSALFIPPEHKDEFKLEKFLAPTQSLLQKWLREEHNIDISIIVNYSHYKDGEITGKKTYRVGVIYIDDDLIETFFIRPKNDDINFIEFNTYEEALEKGLYEALKLIKIKRNEYN